MESLAAVKLGSQMWFAPVLSLLPLMEVGDACLPALSRASASRRGSEADTLDSISGEQA
jgi:hypothetical protein